MLIFKKILNYFLVATILICYQGFFLEEYLCNACSDTHEEISFFEFGEKKHNHIHANKSCGCGDDCGCNSEKHNDEHEKNCKIEYFSLKNLFSSTYKINVKPIILDVLNINVFYLCRDAACHVSTLQIKTFKPPELKFQFAGNINPFAAISVFRI